VGKKPICGRRKSGEKNIPPWFGRDIVARGSSAAARPGVTNSSFFFLGIEPLPPRFI